MEIVVNRCYGGFGLSEKAIEEYLKLKNKKVFRYAQTKYKHRDGENEFTKIMDNKKNHFLIFHFTKDLGESFSEWPKGENAGYFYDHDIDRADKDLIKVIRQLKEDANGNHAELEIVKIPDNIEYVIDDYDGIETVEEKHRSW